MLVPWPELGHLSVESITGGLPRHLGRIHPDDTMFAGDAVSYLQAGALAARICATVHSNTPKSVIDFPSGYGRVTRFLRAALPESQIYCVEVDQHMLQFCEDQFSVHPVTGNSDFTFELPQQVDLIWCGSLLTHLDEWQWDRFLTMALHSLAPEGTLIFTTHGRHHAMMARDRHPLFGDLIDTAELYERYVKQGFAFSPYDPAFPTFGLTLSTPAWLCDKIQRFGFAKIVSFQEAAWGQDVVALTPSAWQLWDE